MSKIKLLGLNLNLQPKSVVLEQIVKYIKTGQDFVHIVSLNPENLVIASENKEFMHVVETAQITIPDGIGVVLAARLKGVLLPERVTGVDLMENMLELAGNMCLRVVLIGGRPNLANTLAQCQGEKYPEAKFYGTIGFKDIKNLTSFEEKQILDIVRRHKPHMIFVAFGSPEQELWLARHSKEFKGTVCMGVGQGFDVLGGIVKRAPKWMQIIGLEWFYRLFTQPWRWRRQLRLIKFMWLCVRG